MPSIQHPRAPTDAGAVLICLWQVAPTGQATRPKPTTSTAQCASGACMHGATRGGLRCSNHHPSHNHTGALRDGASAPCAAHALHGCCPDGGFLAPGVHARAADRHGHVGFGQPAAPPREQLGPGIAGASRAMHSELRLRHFTCQHAVGPCNVAHRS